MEYLLTLHRYHAQFPPEPVGQALGILERYIPQFFPAHMAIGRDQWIDIPDANSFDPSSVPSQYWIQSGQAVRVPIDSLQGPRLEVEDYRQSGPTPSYLGLHWPEEQLPAVDVLRNLLAVLGRTLQADRGRVTDEVTLTRREILERLRRASALVPEALYWLNWFSSKVVGALGTARFEALEASARIEERDGGLLVQLQDTPFRGDIPEQEARRRAAEERFGLRELLNQGPPHLGIERETR